MKAKLLAIKTNHVGALQRLYRLEPGGPLPEYVIVSGVNAFGQGDETYIFRSNDEGKVLEWGELEGSFKGEINHEKALRNAGYEPEAS